MGLEIGPGDDAAVWAPPPGCEVVVTTDSLVEGVHFHPPASEAEARDLGWKLLAVSLSDLAAMGADAGPAFLALALPAAWPVAWLDALYQGLAECASAHGASLAGGNLTTATEPVLTSTCLGSVPAGCALRRTGVALGWELAVTGRVGGAAAGLRDPRWRARQARPTPRLAAGRVLRESGVRVALDVSDGLWLDAARLLSDLSGLTSGASWPGGGAPGPGGGAPGPGGGAPGPGGGAPGPGGGVPGPGGGASGLVIDWTRVPLEPGLAERWPEDVITLAGGGEDYELLFSAPPALMREVIARLAAEGIEAAVIGAFDAGDGVRVLVDGVERPPPASGHVHFAAGPSDG